MIQEMTADVRPALLLLMAGVSALLLIACANVANLFLSRGVARERELAIRRAIGAAPRRLMRQLLSESVVLAFLGGVIGVSGAWAFVRGLPMLALPNVPRLGEVRVDAAVLLFAAAVSVVSTLVASLVPVWRGVRVALADALHGGDGGAGGSVRTEAGQRWRDGLLVVQAAFAVLLLICAALIAQSFVRLTNVDPGYMPTSVLTAQLHFPAGLEASDRNKAVMQRLLERLRGLPDVVAAGGGNMMPLDGNAFLAGFPVTPLPEVQGRRPVSATALRYAVTPGYAEALGLRLREGRFFDESDAVAGVLPMIVNEEFARLYLPRNPLGTPLKWGEPVSAEIVGNVLKDGNDRQPQPEFHVPLAARDRLRRVVPVVVRTRGNPATVGPLLRSYVADVAPEAAVDLMPLADRMALAVSRPRFTSGVLGTFSLFALLLASVGLHSVLSYTVSTRRRELGVRAALGASRTDLMWLVVRCGVLVAAVGLGVGVVSAAGVTPLLERLLFGVSPLDAVSFATAPLLFIPVALTACVLPALRAASTDPAEVLRGE